MFIEKMFMRKYSFIQFNDIYFVFIINNSHVVSHLKTYFDNKDILILLFNHSLQIAIFMLLQLEPE